jgi:hypothetical protein
MKKKLWPQENVTYSTIGGTCFSGKTEVELYMKLKRNVFKLGEKIPVHVECTISGGSAEVDKVSCFKYRLLLLLLLRTAPGPSTAVVGRSLGIVRPLFRPLAISPERVCLC